MLIRRYLILVLTAAITGALLFGWGYRRGAASVEMRDSTVTRWVPWPVPVYDTIREPYPVAVREPADTVWKYMSVDTAAIIADYLLERDYRLDFSADSTGTFLVDATVGENRLLRAAAVVKPVVREITVTKLHTEVRPPRWEMGLALGIDPYNQWAGIYGRYTRGRWGGDIILGYNPLQEKSYIAARATLTIFSF
jgi:hypothetical protein